MSYSKKEEKDEPMTPVGRFFLHPEMDQVINCHIGFKHPIDSDSIKFAVKNSVMIQHPRFRSLYVKDQHGKQHWKLIDDLDLDKHIFERLVNNDGNLDDEQVVNGYLADLSVSTPLDTDKPLWEIHVLKEYNCLVLRLHHALGDGVSLMSLFLMSCRRVDAPDQLPTVRTSSSASSTKGKKGNYFDMLRMLAKLVFLTLVYVMKFVLRSIWVKDTKTSISGGPGVELWPRKLATAKFNLEDMKLVKKAVYNGTINDVLFGVITSGLSRYLDMQSSNEREGLQITGLAMVNLRPQKGLQELSNLMKNESKSRSGNQFGYVLLPIYYQKDVADPLQFVRRAKTMLDRKKLSLEAYFTYKFGYLVMTLLGPKAAYLLNNRVVCNTSFTLSNVVGPEEETSFGGNPITYLRANSTSLSHAITMHMLSYAGKAEMQILVAKDIIPDPRVLAKCFEDALLEMKEAASAT